MTPQEWMEKATAIQKKYGWKDGDVSYYFDGLGNVYKVDRWWNPVHAECLLKFGNSFEAEEDAKAFVEKLKTNLKQK